MYCGTIFFLVNYATYLFYFRKNLLEWMYDKTITIDDQIKDENIQYEINREAAKISALSSGKINKHEYLTREEILPSNQKQVIQQAKST